MVVNRLHGEAHSRHEEVHAVPTNSAGEPADFQGSVGGLHQKSFPNPHTTFGLLWKSGLLCACLFCW